LRGCVRGVVGGGVCWHAAMRPGTQVRADVNDEAPEPPRRRSQRVRRPVISYPARAAQRRRAIQKGNERNRAQPLTAALYGPKDTGLQRSGIRSFPEAVLVDLQRTNPSDAATIVPDQKIQPTTSHGGFRPLSVGRLPDLGSRAQRFDVRLLFARSQDPSIAWVGHVESLRGVPDRPIEEIFVVEDDSQNGLDHVDGYRSIFLAITLARNYEVGANGRLWMDTLPLTGAYTTCALQESDPNLIDYVTDSATLARDGPPGTRRATDGWPARGARLRGSRQCWSSPSGPDSSRATSARPS
jgi:hypothetical protein